MKQIRQTALKFALLWLVLAGSSLVQAHPHMWVQATMQLGFNASGEITYVKQAWVFDEMFSSYAKQGLPETSDKRPAQELLDQIGRSWIEALADPMSHYFTTIRYGGRELATQPARNVKVGWNSETQQMSLQFELPLLQPLNLKGQDLSIAVADPTFYVAYSFDEPQALELIAAPESCKAVYQPPQRLDIQTAQRLAALPANVTELPDDLMSVTQTLQHRVNVSCQP
jgi:tRNA threonylcarbamoyladenosine biosynthesis protein TsaE